MQQPRHRDCLTPIHAKWHCLSIPSIPPRSASIALTDMGIFKKWHFSTR
jgi:hypothetical protein